MDADAALIGRTIAGRYRIERCIGRGGMAAVFAATQDGEPHEVAVKVMKRDLMKDATVVKRFRREAKAAAMLNHPNTVKVLDYGVDGEDAYIAMELAKGKDLFQALAEERPMPQTRAALIVAQVGAALSAAHAQGIVHRDLKPENVMLVPSLDLPGGELVKVLDFGIAKILEAPSPDGGNAAQPQERSETSTNLTRVGTVVGTPAYMSPEQCRGGELDGRSDVYSAGVLLYQLVTGQLPFLGETPLHTAMRHIHAPPRPPSEIRPGLHKGLERVVLKALAKWPGERQQSAEQLREELTALIDALPDRDQILGPRAGRVDPRKEPEDDAATGRSEGNVPHDQIEGAPGAPGAIQRQPTEQQLGMRLGGGLGKLVSPTDSGSSPPPPPRPSSPPIADVDDELSRSETPLTEPQPTRPLGLSGERPIRALTPRSQRGRYDDDEERTRLRPARGGPAMDAAIAAILAKPPTADLDDDDGPRTALMSPPGEGRDTKRRANRTLLMDPAAADGAAEAVPAGPEPALGDPPGIRQTVRLGSPSPVARADLPPSANKDVPAAYARTQNVRDAALLQAIEEDALARESPAREATGPGGRDFMQVKATMRITDEASVGGGAQNMLGAAAMIPPPSHGILAPPLAPPPAPPAPPPPMSSMTSMTGDALAVPPQLRRAGTRGFIENLPGTTVLVVGVALGVVVSAIVAVLVVFLARGS